MRRDDFAAPYGKSAMTKAKQEITKLHRDAIEAAHRADALARLAFERERDAADLCPVTEEPTHGILCSSAAFLACQAGEAREALRLVNAGLKGKPDGHTRQRLDQARRKAELSIQLEAEG